MNIRLANGCGYIFKGKALDKTFYKEIRKAQKRLPECSGFTAIQSVDRKENLRNFKFAAILNRHLWVHENRNLI